MASSVLKGTRLAGKVCIITGAGSLHGIGRATAHRFAREGARHLYLVDLVADNFPTIQSSLHETNPDVKVTTIQADAADEEKIASICKMATNENGRLDVFFANAGKVVANSDSLEPYQTISAEQFMKCISNNTLSCFLALKHAADAMAKADESAGKLTGGGSIILTSSIAGIRSGLGPMDYSASKAAIISLAQTASFQHQVTRTGVRVNAICPGAIKTDLSVSVLEMLRERNNSIGQTVTFSRVGVPEEVANVALFLASDESSFVTGQQCVVDDGLSNFVSMDKLRVEW